MNCSTPGLPVHHQLPEFTHTHVHRVSDAIQPSHPLLSPSPPAPNSSQHEVAKVLEFQLQHHSLQRNPRADLQNGLVGSLCNPRDSQESSSTPQFKSINLLVLSFLYDPAMEKPFVGKVMSLLFNMLSKLVIAFLTRSKRLLISWLQSPSAVILEPRKIKSNTVSTVFLSISH